MPTKVELDISVGARGLSAYESAVQNGFEGTEEEWSIAGNAAANAAIEAGEARDEAVEAQGITTAARDITVTAKDDAVIAKDAAEVAQIAAEAVILDLTGNGIQFSFHKLLANTFTLCKLAFKSLQVQ